MDAFSFSFKSLVYRKIIPDTSQYFKLFKHFQPLTGQRVISGNLSMKPNTNLCFFPLDHECIIITIEHCAVFLQRLSKGEKS